MLLSIDDNKTIAELQEKFNECFPLLCLKFYKKAHGRKEPSAEEDLISPQTRVGSIRKKHDSGVLDIKSWQTVHKIEADLKKKFDLNVQVFRKERNEWIQTTSTDKYTLSEQEEFSRHAKVSIDPEKSDQLDEYGYL